MANKIQYVLIKKRNARKLGLLNLKVNETASNIFLNELVIKYIKVI